MHVNEISFFGGGGIKQTGLKVHNNTSEGEEREEKEREKIVAIK